MPYSHNFAGSRPAGARAAGAGGAGGGADGAAAARRVGLALSGGGFRAALFHAGAIARLARAGALGAVEVISTVSGGSIAGLLLHLLLKRLLETKRDEEITREDYVQVAEELCQRLFALTSRGVMWAAVGHPRDAVLVSFELSGEHSRLDTIARQIRKYLYEPLVEEMEAEQAARREEHRGGGKEDARDSAETTRADASPLDTLEGLKIQPKGAPDGFEPGQDNSARTNKVPILLMNCTVLNDSHRWVFSSVGWCGEVVGDSPLDHNPPLPRVWYADMPERMVRRLHPALAAAASAAVPGAINPLELKGKDLWPQGAATAYGAASKRRVSVGGGGNVGNRSESPPADQEEMRPRRAASGHAFGRRVHSAKSGKLDSYSERLRKCSLALADGGASDNTGIQTLLDAGCDLLLASNAGSGAIWQSVPSSLSSNLSAGLRALVTLRANLTKVVVDRAASQAALVVHVGLSFSRSSEAAWFRPSRAAASHRINTQGNHRAGLHILQSARERADSWERAVMRDDASSPSLTMADGSDTQDSGTGDTTDGVVQHTQDGVEEEVAPELLRPARPLSKDVLNAVRVMRTALDSFSEVEACSLAAVGYIECGGQLARHAEQLVALLGPHGHRGRLLEPSTVAEQEARVRGVACAHSNGRTTKVIRAFNKRESAALSLEEQCPRNGGRGENGAKKGFAPAVAIAEVGAMPNNAPIVSDEDASEDSEKSAVPSGKATTGSDGLVEECVPFAFLEIAPLLRGRTNRADEEQGSSGFFYRASAPLRRVVRRARATRARNASSDDGTRRAAQDVLMQLRAGSSQIFRHHKLYPWLGRLLLLLVVCCVLAALGVIIWVIVDQFWDYPNRESVRSWGNSVLGPVAEDIEQTMNQQLLDPATRAFSLYQFMAFIFGDSVNDAIADIIADSNFTTSNFTVEDFVEFLEMDNVTLAPSVDLNFTMDGCVPYVEGQFAFTVVDSLGLVSSEGSVLEIPAKFRESFGNFSCRIQMGVKGPGASTCGFDLFDYSQPYAYLVDVTAEQCEAFQDDEDAFLSLFLAFVDFQCPAGGGQGAATMSLARQYNDSCFPVPSTIEELSTAIGANNASADPFVNGGGVTTCQALQTFEEESICEDWDNRTISTVSLVLIVLLGSAFLLASKFLPYAGWGTALIMCCVQLVLAWSHRYMVEPLTRRRGSMERLRSLWGERG